MIGNLQTWLMQPRFQLGESTFSAFSLVKLVVYLVLVIVLARLLRRFLARRLFPRFHMETGMAYALASITFYAILVIGLMVALQTSGIRLQAVTVILGALGIGVGFGLQQIAANFVSGLIILMERPVQVGDRIEIGRLHGRVMRVKLRATEVLTNDNIAVIVPNAEVTTQQVINWSRGGNQIRVRIPVTVAYGSEPETVRGALLEAADSVPAALKTPPPRVRLAEFGESGMRFELLSWTTELLHQRGEFISRVNFAIHASLKRHGIAVPLPQREVTVRRAPRQAPPERG